MTERNLLENFALSGVQVVKLHAELHRTFAPEQQMQARVEVKLSPGPLPEGAGSGMPVYQVGARVSCQGFLINEGEETAVFTLECVLNALYNQVFGDPISQEAFAQNHTSLTRQLYPLINQQLTPLLAQFGLYNIKLPQDILHRPDQPVAKPQQVH